MEICGVCAVAPLGPEDRFCFFCASPLRKLEVALSAAAVVAGGEEDESWLEGAVRNAGQFGNRARLLPVEVPWLAVFDAAGAEPPADGWVLAPGASVPFRVRVRPRLALSGLPVAVLRVAGAEGTAADETRAEVRVFAQPQVRVDWPGDAALWMDEEVAPELAGTLVLSSGNGTRVRAVESEAPWAEAEAAAGEGAVALRLRVDLPRLKAQFASDDRPAAAEVPLRVVLADPELVLPARVAVPLRWPAALDVWGRDRENREAEVRDGRLTWELPAGRYHLLSLSLANPGGRTAVLEGLDTAPPGAPLYPVGASPASAAPWEIEPGTERSLIVAADLRSGADPVEATLTLSTNVPGHETAGVPVRVVPRARPEFTGHVGIDFGTTNSCIAVWAENQNDPEVGVVLGGYRYAHQDAPRPRAVLASNVLYHAHPAATLRTCEVGRELGQEGADPVESARVIHSVKRFLGEKQSLRVRYGDGSPEEMYPADEIAGDIIQRLLWDAEEVLGQRIGRCALTHPVSFSTLQLTRLLGILQGLNIEVERALPEPVAAALHFITGTAIPVPDPHDYTVLVFDIGGGTTDLAVLRVLDQGERESRKRTIRPKLLRVAGVRWAGGDDITWMAVESYLEHLTDDEIAAGVLNVDRASLPVVRDAVLRRNPFAWRDDVELNRIFGLAERVKRSRADEAWGDGSGAIMGSEAALLPSDVDLAAIADRFLDRNGLLALAGQTIEKAEINSVDLILLVGQSWRIRRLRDRVQEHFGGVAILPDLATAAVQLKEPVALGACRAHAYSSGANYKLVPDDLMPLSTARIGVLGFDENGRRAFLQVIAANEPLGSWSPVRFIELTRAKPIRIFENTGVLDDPQIVEGARRIDNPEIRLLGEVRLRDHLDDDVTDGDLENALLSLSLNEHHEVELKLDIDGRPALTFPLRPRGA